MDDRELDIVLRGIGRERHVPSPRVVQLAKSRVRGRRLVQLVSALSLITQLITFGVAVSLLSVPDIDPTARIAGAVALFAYVGCIVIVLVAARQHLRPFFKRLEQLAA